jgi:hypothetical protein
MSAGPVAPRRCGVLLMTGLATQADTAMER